MVNSKNNSEKNKKFKINEEDTLENIYPLTESQLNIYLDIVAQDKLDAYLMPLNVTISDKYNVDTEPIIDTIKYGNIATPDTPIPPLMKSDAMNVAVKPQSAIHISLCSLKFNTRSRWPAMKYDVANSVLLPIAGIFIGDILAR